MLNPKPDFKKIEAKWQKWWEKNKIYKFDIRSNKPIYSIDTPPPYASAAHLHVGHALNYTQFEIVSRYKRMRGFNIYFSPCFDNNGLPTEKYVEEKLGISKANTSRSKFREICRREAKKVETEYSDRFFRALGHAYDWNLLYTTIAPEAQRVAQMSFLDLYNKGYVYRANEPVLWCPYHQTALAQAEVEDLKRRTLLNYIHFELENGKRIEIATTRPELLAACVGLFVHPKDKRYRNLIGKKARVPLFDYWVEIRADEKVDREFGSGIVMVCTFGDTTDIEWWRKHRLDMKIVFTQDGKLNDLARKYKGLSIKQAKEAIAKDLECQGYMIKQEPLEQSVGACWRCNNPIEFIPTKQWFVRTLKFKKQIIAKARKVKWHPDFYRKRLEDWTNNLGWDWIISRQRYYGVPIPVWYCKTCGKEKIAASKDLPIDPTKDKPNGKCSCGSTQFVPEIDVFDTWFTSSMSPEIAGRWLENPALFKRVFPMDLRPQSHDIIRTWAFYTLLKSHLHFNTIPWKNLMISNFVLDPRGRGMSKSKGNVVWLHDLMHNYSADTIRYWVATASLGKDMPFMEKDMKHGHRILLKLWNTARFVEINLNKSPKTRPKLKFVDRWILSRLAETLKNYLQNFDNYNLSKARYLTEQFFLKEFCDFYLEMVKYRIYGSDAKSKAAAQWTLRICLLNIIKMFAPFIPHITEEIYQNLFKEEKSIHVSQFPTTLHSDATALKLGRLAVKLIGDIRQYKQKRNMSLGAELTKLTITHSNTTDICKIADVIAGTMRIKDLQIKQGKFAITL